MAPLITREEARVLGELVDHAEIEALVERGWRARVERFGDSTDMCSLVNAKSGGCAEDCGFCAQSRFADADTPMHAMMEPEQMLEHARAAEAAGAHRFCMVAQGQGLSRRDFEKILEGARLVARHTNLKRCASIGHISVDRARALREAGIQRVHHNVESAESFYPEVSSTVRYEGRLRTIDAVREAGLETCVGGILNLGETPEQRIENLGELGGMAVRAGLNGVMMGNFLTALGATPEQDREMFEEHGLNISRQHDNGTNPRPDNRSGWLEGETPDLVENYLEDTPEMRVHMWDPSTQLRFRSKRAVS